VSGPSLDQARQALQRAIEADGEDADDGAAGGVAADA
jgi:hypothetical protein